MKPIIFQTSFFALHTFWIFFGLGLIVTIITLTKLSILRGLKLQFISDNALKILLWFLVGARIIGIITNYQTYFYELSSTAFFRLFFIWDKGLNLWGGIIGALIYLYFSCKKSEQDFWKWLDAIIPSLIAGLAVGHIGAFFDGINYGNETSLPWGVNFESPAIKYAVPIHPTQIYAFLYSTIITISIIIFSQSEKLKNLDSGLIGLFSIEIYTFLRFLEEFVRGDDTWIIFGIRFPHIISFIILIGTGTFIYYRYNGTKFKHKS